ncbi:hypothetical protein OSB04_018704 [Centaurea solstitialis]|uniref:ADP-ribosyl cyclase/cyclic ADP-ribose hydrolase n=1 Tax=Centaurea solstitialis TaxID=347529 RepID=A0AA38WM00_9ASTR|nr:hypothetical protein OSB04_018704 [Centaurea solstitialis]
MDPSEEQINPSMPSSSSSSHSTPPSSSSSPSPKYDVFLSFRGTDTRNTFVDHLYSTLIEKGIDTYKDDKTLPRGETIGPSLLKAIEESCIVVIVFSENYADSSWCLQELAHIMKCKDERGLTVMPIFYHIDPSELRKQKGKYGEALAKHESKDKNVESWRKALVDAGNLSGDVANGPETIFIKQIVDTISNRLPALISHDNEDLVGIEARLQILKSKMEMELDGVVMVGIWGVGGGGKTTLASALYHEIYSNFDGCCFVENIREESRKRGLPKLQELILSHVLKQKGMEVDSVDEGRRLIKSRFSRKKVLILLDDIDHLDQLKALAGSRYWFGEGSRIIITTRDSHVLNVDEVKVIYDISLLTNDEASKLFRKHAVGHDSPIEDYERLSKDVVSYAGGLPLALKVIGSFLCDKDMTEWKSALARLKDIPESDIVEKLKVSYDGLKAKEKELFLDIVCFYRGKEKDKAMVILDACGFHPIIGVKVLIQKALITVSEKGRFDMHDLIQEMGHYIVQGEDPENPESHSRVWRRKDVVKICAMDAMMENDRIEALLFEQHRGMPPPTLPQVVSNMKKLRWISCVNHSSIALPRAFQAMKLRCLELEMSFLKQVWEGYKHLPNLKVLNLSYSRKLIRTPDLDGLPCLERMILNHCDMLREIHPSLGYHERLMFLDMQECFGLEIFPPIIRMKSLSTLLLSYCTQLRKFPEIQTNMDSLVELSLRWSGIEIAPSSIGQYCTNLVYLDMRNCSNLESIEGNFHRLERLKGLYLHGCLRLKNIPAEGLFDVKCCLQVLSFSSNLHRGMESLKLFRFSSSLTRLNLSGCNLVDGDMSSVFCELSNLQVLDLSDNSFSRLHSSLLQLHRLKLLDLTLCSKLVELPDLPSDIAILKAHHCNSLNIVGGLPTNLKWLWKVSLSSKSILGDVKRVLLSMLQGDAIQDYFASLHFWDKCISMRGCEKETFMLQLPLNWYNEFGGFLIYIDGEGEGYQSIVAQSQEHIIRIDDVMGKDYEDNVLEAFGGTQTLKIDEVEDDESEKADAVCYISFNSLRHTSWWNSRHNTISFSIKGICLKVELVPRRGKGDGSIERTKDATCPSAFWDEESPHRKTFEIIQDSRSSINISWCHRHRLVLSINRAVHSGPQKIIKPVTFEPVSSPICGSTGSTGRVNPLLPRGVTHPTSITNPRVNDRLNVISDDKRIERGPFKNSFIPGFPHFPAISLLNRSTKTFAEANIIARSGFGKVYRGQSAQYGIIAIKQLDRMHGKGDREFMMEIALLSICKHENIVSLVGFCDEGGEKILVYRYEQNGSLDRLLHSKDQSWMHRLRICLGAAFGLKYLHDDVGPQLRVLHRDVKSANILLDENWKPKISDFRLSKIALANVPLSALVSNPCGTPGYVDPQYMGHNTLTQKSDVYSFGVVLVMFIRIIYKHMITIMKAHRNINT